MDLPWELPNVPDSVLEKLRCSCGRYLSSCPIFASQDGQSICSKCMRLQPSPLGVVIQNVAYEALAALFKFPCCYKPQGCLQYDDFNKAISDHEYECLYRIYECPVNLFSSCNKSGTTTELWEHYQTNHPDLYLEQPAFSVDVTADFEFHRLFKVDDVLFLLQSKCSISAGKLWFNTLYFGNSDNASLLSYNIKLSSSDDKKRAMELEQVNVYSIINILMLSPQFVEVDISVAAAFLNSSKLQCHWVIHMPDGLNDRLKNQQKLKLEKRFEAKQENTRCPFCRIFMVPPIYRCDQGHVTCIDCRGYDNQCRDCMKFDARFITAADLELISISGIHNCKWRNCNHKCSHDMIRSHEQECFYRVYRCPECNWSGIYDMFLSHFKNVHRDVNILVTNVVALSLLNGPASYIVVQREIFKYDVASQLGFGTQYQTIDISVHFLGSPSYANYWKYEVKDNLGNVYPFEGGQYTATVRINENRMQTNFKFGNGSLYNGKCYNLYITKNVNGL